TGFIKCETVEYEAYLQNKFPKRATTDEFENWIAPKAQLIKQQVQSGNFRGGINMIPVIFHVITDGAGGDNLSAAAIQAQLDQLNIDYANLAGSSYGSAADTQIQFCLAQVDENGMQLNEPGINRVTTYGGGPFSTSTIQSNIKAATQWDPEQYMNIWTANISGGILGYAQFPDPAGTGLDGLDPDDVGPLEAANTDGVVIAANSVGSVANPNPLGAPYNKGRTLTHEAGHWLGLRHIWGDTSACTNDDYCADTPDASAENYGCPTIDHCPSDGLGNDMVENYMDYTDDSCMDTFTADQASRILAVITNSPRRANLLTSTACSSSPIIGFSSSSMNEVEGSSCVSHDISIPVVIGMGASANATVTFTTSGTATNMSDYEILTPSVTFPAGSNAPQNLMIRIYEDAYVEADETIIVNMTLNANGGDAELATNGNETLTVTILDDDNAPNPGSVVTLFSDDFESYSNFIIDGIGDWITIDVDGSPTYTGGTATPTWPNANAAMAYQIFNPAAAGVTNATSGTETRNFDPRSGAKYAAAWAAVPGANPANDDWLVSPVLSLGASGNSVSFWVKAMSNSYGPENYNV